MSKFGMLTLRLSLVAVLVVKIRVPGNAGLKVFLIKMGMSASTAGCMVFGWMTLAPKYASSIASLKDTCGRMRTYIHTHTLTHTHTHVT